MPTQREIVLFVKNFTAANGYPPSRRDIANEYRISTSTVQDRLQKAVEGGLLEVPAGPPGGRRALTVTREGMKLLHPSSSQF